MDKEIVHNNEANLSLNPNSHQFQLDDGSLIHKRKGRTYKIRRRKKLKKSSNISAITPNIYALSKYFRGLPRDNAVAKLKPYFFEDTGRGLMSMKSIKKGSIIIRVPYDSLITCEKIINDPAIGSVLDKCDKIKDTDLLTFYLLYIINNPLETKWNAYLDTLPKSHTNLSYCSDIESIYLDDLEKVYDLYNNKLTDSFDIVQKYWICTSKHISALPQSINFEDFKWAWFIINSRCIYLKGPDLKLISGMNKCALAPYLDLFNHSVDADTSSHFNTENNCFEIRTNVPYKKYEQVFINYGPHDNLRLLADYGFVLQNNPNDNYPITLADLSASFNTKSMSLMSHAKERIINTQKLSHGSCITSEGPSWNLLAMMSILQMDEDELDGWKDIYNGIECLTHYDLVISLLEFYISLKIERFKCKEQDLKCVIRPPSNSYIVAIQYFKEFTAMLESAKSWLSKELQKLKKL